VAVALFPTLATHFARGAMDAYRHDLARMMRQTVLLSLPSAVLCCTLAAPIMRLLFEHGAFGPEDTLGTAGVLLWSSVGIVPLSLQYIVARGFYALHETRTPLWVGGLTAVLSIALSLLVYRPLGVNGLAGVYSLTNLFNAGLMTWLLRRRVGPLEGRQMVTLLAKIALPCVAMGLIGFFGSAGLERALGTAGLTAKAAVCLVPLAAGLAIFAGLCVILRVPEFGEAMAAFGRRFRRGPSKTESNATSDTDD
jgi:putative peptidoglycan lipid II flippase